MNRPPSDASSAEKIQAALDEMVAKSRRERGASTSSTGPLAAPAASPLPAERRPLARWILIGLLAVTVHASGIYWYVQSRSSRPEMVLVVEPAPPSAPETVPPSDADAIPSAAEGAAAGHLAPSTAADGSTRVIRSRGPGQAGVITYNGETIIVPASPASSAPPPRRTVVAATAAAPVARAASATAEEPTRLSLRAHAEAAKEFAYYHFRYKYKVGSVNYAITSQSLRITRTEEIASWSRYRSSGEVGLEYYDNSGFRRTTRRFEVITEDKNGEATALEITVK